MNDRKHEEYLPIGTIILLKNEITMYMIVGYFDIEKEIKNDIDYAIIPFPYGMMNLDMIRMIEKKDIEKIVKYGYKNEQFNKLNNSIRNFFEKNKGE